MSTQSMVTKSHSVHLHLQYRKGSEHGNADALSRIAKSAAESDEEKLTYLINFVRLVAKENEVSNMVHFVDSIGKINKF